MANLYNLFLTHRPGWVGGFLKTIDFLKPNDTSISTALGVEYERHIWGAFTGAARGGFSTNLHTLDGLKGVSAGFGLSYRDSMAFDFAWIPFGDLGNTFRYSLKVKF